MLGNRITNKTKEFVETEEKFVKYEWNHYKTVLMIIVILLTLEAYLEGSLQNFLESLGEYEYLGALLAGFFYTYGLTTPFSVAVIFVLAHDLNPWITALLGATGSLISEYLIYAFVRERTEKLIKGNKIGRFKIPKNDFLKKISPIIAGLIIASPLPDELAAALLAMEKYDVKKFIVLTFVFNFLGILFLVGLGKIFSI
jgi:uncharacterized membrane protein YdjX (TVP38/TMEM64 family)